LKFVDIIVKVIEKNTGWIKCKGMILLKSIARVPSEELRKEFVSICLPTLIRLLDPSSPTIERICEYLFIYIN
jgi:hypothetical protein